MELFCLHSAVVDLPITVIFDWLHVILGECRQNVSPPPNRPNGWTFSLPVSLIKSISVRASCGYLCGGFALPLSMQKLCILHGQHTKALTLLIGILAFKGDFSIRQQFVRIPNAHSMLIRTCD